MSSANQQQRHLLFSCLLLYFFLFGSLRLGSALSAHHLVGLQLLLGKRRLLVSHLARLVLPSHSC